MFPAGDIFLQDVILDGPADAAGIGAGAFGHGHVQGQKNRCRGVDGHRRGNFLEVDAVEEPLHVLDGIDSDSHFSYLAQGHGVIGIHADLCRQIEGNGEAGGAVREQIFVAPVGLFGVAHARVLAHGPEAPAIHGGLHPARVREFSGVGEIAIVIEFLEISGGVQGLRVNLFELAGFGFDFCLVGHGLFSPNQALVLRAFTNENTVKYAHARVTNVTTSNLEWSAKWLTRNWRTRSHPPQTVNIANSNPVTSSQSEYRVFSTEIANPLPATSKAWAMRLRLLGNGGLTVEI